MSEDMITMSDFLRLGEGGEGQYVLHGPGRRRKPDYVEHAIPLLLRVQDERGWFLHDSLGAAESVLDEVGKVAMHNGRICIFHPRIF